MKPHFSRITAILSLLICCLQMHGQRGIEKWHLGQNVLVDFGITTIPRSFTTSGLNTSQSSTTVSDEDGNIILYTDGFKFYNKNDQEMLDLFPDAPNSIHRKVLAARHPGGNNFYYIFYTSGSDFFGNAEWDLCYTIVDINAEAGRGRVIQKHRTIASGMSLGFTLVKHANNNEFWLIANKVRTKEFHVYHVATAGLNLTSRSTWWAWQATPRNIKWAI
jgi:hypothetical protein